jgi:hypothetical protein
MLKKIIKNSKLHNQGAKPFHFQPKPTQQGAKPFQLQRKPTQTTSTYLCTNPQDVTMTLKRATKLENSKRQSKQYNKTCNKKDIEPLFLPKGIKILPPHHE